MNESATYSTKNRYHRRLDGSAFDGDCRFNRKSCLNITHKVRASYNRWFMHGTFLWGNKKYYSQVDVDTIEQRVKSSGKGSTDLMKSFSSPVFEVLHSEQSGLVIYWGLFWAGKMSLSFADIYQRCSISDKFATLFYRRYNWATWALV